MAWTAAAAPKPSGPDLPALAAEAEELVWLGAAGAALEIAQKTLDAGETSGNPAIVARSLAVIGTARAYQGDEGGARQAHAKAISIARQSADHSVEAAVISHRGLVAWRRGEYAEALKAFEQARSLQEGIGDQAGLGRTLDLMGRVSFKRGDYPAALDLYARAVAVQSSTGDHRGRAATLEDLGDLYQEQGAYAAAFERYAEALRAREEAHDPRGQAYLLAIIGRCYMLQGAYRRGTAHFELARKVSEAAGDRYGRAAAFHHLGITLDLQDRPREALEAYGRALADYRFVGDTREEAWILYRVAEARRRMGDLEGALSAHEESSGIWERIGDPRGLGRSFEALGRLRADMGAPAAALEILERAKSLREGTQPSLLPSVLVAIAKVHADGGDLVRALEYSERALELARRSGHLEVHWRTAYALAGVRLRGGSREEALKALEESLSVIEQVRRGLVSSDEARSGFLESKQAVYAGAIALLTDLGRSEEALEVAERARARAFLDLLESRSSTGVPEDGALAFHSPESRESRDHPFPLRPEPASHIAVPSPSRAQIREEARLRKTTLVEYFSADDRLYSWVVQPDGAMRSAVAPIGRADLTELVAQMRATLSGSFGAREPEEAPGRGDPSRPLLPASSPGADPGPALEKLDRALIEPLASWLPNDPDASVTIVPHGPLFLVSFAALPDRNGRPLVERHTLHYSPSVAVLAHTRRSRRPRERLDSLLVVGNPAMPRLPGRSRSLAPLPGAESEARAIGRLFSAASVRTLTGASARERLVRAIAPERTILHLATHAVVFDDEPLESFVALAPERAGAAPGTRPRGIGTGSDGDGLWTAREVFQLELRAELVALSACNTGLGGISGDGVIGLTRAFLSAGAPSVLASLWRVADLSGRYQMERFYRALRANGGRKAAALRQAELDTLRALREKRLRTASGRPLAEHPLFWAPFILVGEPD